MPIVTRCHECKRKLNVADKLAEKAVKCPHCGHKMVVHKSESAPSTAKASESGGHALLDPAKKKQVGAKAPPHVEPSAAREGPPPPKKKVISDLSELPPLHKPHAQKPSAPEEDPGDEPPPRPPAAKAPPAPRPSEAQDEDDDEEGRPLAPWGAAAFVLAALAGVQIFWPNVLWLTISLAALSLAAVLLGLVFSRSMRRGLDWALLGLGGSISAVLLPLAIYLPGWLHLAWDPPPPLDLQKMVRVPREHPAREGKPLAADEWVDGITEAIRQEDVVIRIEGIEIKKLEGRGETTYMTLHLRLANLSRDHEIPVTKIAKDVHPPTLQDETGRKYAFLEEWPRKPDPKGVFFESNFPKATAIKSSFYQDQLLVFEAPSAPVPLKLELSAAIWGRKGTAKLSIERYSP